MIHSDSRIARLILGWVCTATAFFTVSTAVPIYLAERGFSPLVGGALVSVGWIGTLIACLNAPRTASPRRHHQLICHLGVMSCLLLCLTDDVLVWFMANAALGYTLGVRWIYTDAWLLMLAGEKRGRIIGLYEACSGATLFFGPAIAAITLSAGSPTLGYALLSSVIAGVIVCNVELDEEKSVAGRANVIKDLFQNLIRHPAVMIACLGGGIFESGSGAPLSLWIIGELQHSPTFAAAIVSAIGIGSFLMQLPFGLASERYGAGRMQLLSAILLPVSAAALGYFSHLPWVIIAIAFIWGGIGGGLYTLSAIRLGNTLHGGNLISAISVAVTGYTLGGIFGPLIGGAILSVWPQNGLAVFYVGIGMVTLGGLILERLMVTQVRRPRFA